MKRKFSILFFIIAFVTLVVMPTGETVQAYEKQQIETLESDLNLINNDVEFEFTENYYPIMIVEVEISYGNYYEGLQDNMYNCYETNYSQTALSNNLNNPFKENYCNCSNNYLTSFIWQYSKRTSPANNPKLRTDDDHLKFCKLYEEVGISPISIQGPQLT